MAIRKRKPFGRPIWGSRGSTQNNAKTGTNQPAYAMENPGVLGRWRREWR
jgi:hypothetical protein